MLLESLATYLRWEHPGLLRYYEVRLSRDLWGGWALMSCWGRIGTPAGRLVISPKADDGECRKALDGIAKRRRAHGYAMTHAR